MSKRLNKRQQRELEELAELKAAQEASVPVSDNEGEDVDPSGATKLDEKVEEDDSQEEEELAGAGKVGAAPVNLFAAVSNSFPEVVGYPLGAGCVVCMRPS